MEVKQLEFELVAIRDVSIASGGLTCYATIPVPVSVFKNKNEIIQFSLMTYFKFSVAVVK